MNSPSSPARAVRRALAVCFGVAVIGALAVPRAEAADNTLVSASPASGSSVDSSPPSLLLTFANPLGATNNLQVVCNGTPYSVGTPQVGVDGISLTASVPNPLPKGNCVVSWLVSTPDGQGAGSSTFSFTILNDTAPAAA
jgi:methionine-rich copper-binding protein CopC